MDMESFFFSLGVTMRRPSIQSKSSQCNASSHPNRKKGMQKALEHKKRSHHPNNNNHQTQATTSLSV